MTTIENANVTQEHKLAVVKQQQPTAESAFSSMESGGFEETTVDTSAPPPVIKVCVASQMKRRLLCAFRTPHLAAVAHHGLEAVLRVQVPPLHEAVLGAERDTHGVLLSVNSWFSPTSFISFYPRKGEITD